MLQISADPQSCDGPDTAPQIFNSATDRETDRDRHTDRQTAHPQTDGTLTDSTFFLFC